MAGCTNQVYRISETGGYRLPADVVCLAINRVLSPFPPSALTTLNNNDIDGPSDKITGVVVTYDDCSNHWMMN